MIVVLEFSVVYLYFTNKTVGTAAATAAATVLRFIESDVHEKIAVVAEGRQ